MPGQPERFGARQRAGPGGAVVGLLPLEGLHELGEELARGVDEDGIVAADGLARASLRAVLRVEGRSDHVVPFAAHRLSLRLAITVRKLAGALLLPARRTVQPGTMVP